MTQLADQGADRSAYIYVVLRVAPNVEREEFINVGVVLYCRARRFLDARVALNRARLYALAPNLDAATVTLIQAHLELVPQICTGRGPIGQLAQPERFRWLAAPRSTMLQTSDTHGGLCGDPRAALEHLFEILVK
ncbi:MAG: DUF3037 domain-containing protein [Caldilineaceae bacterium]